jgi:hypothetical protein
MSLLSSIIATIIGQSCDQVLVDLIKLFCQLSDKPNIGITQKITRPRYADTIDLATVDRDAHLRRAHR